MPSSYVDTLSRNPELTRWAGHVGKHMSDRWVCSCWGHLTLTLSLGNKSRLPYLKQKMSSMSSSSEWFRVQKSGLWDPLLRGWGKKWFTDRFWFSFYTQFNFIGPITWVRLNENFWEVEADSQTHSLHTAIRPMAAEFHILRSCLAVSDKHHPEQLPGKHERAFLSAVRFLGGQEEMGPDMKD